MANKRSQNTSDEMISDFWDLVKELPHLGFKNIAGDLIRCAQYNGPLVKKSLKDLPPLKGAKAKSGVVISAGPSVHKQDSINRILKAKYKGSIIAVDGCYIACLKAGLIPDYVVTLDPGASRVVRWFGDPDFEKNSEGDDYFVRQDLDVEFRKNSIAHNKENIRLVNKYGPQTKAIVATSAPHTVVNRLIEAKFDMYWWNPLVDNPLQENSLTKKLYDMNGLPCMNTGGTVGTAAWVFAASRLNIPHLAVVGMDLGYYEETPIEQTQTYYELVARHGSLEGVEKYFAEFVFPLTGKKYYTDPTYFWYRNNFLDLLKQAGTVKTYNCTEAGTLVDPIIPCMSFDEFLRKY